MDEQDDHKLKEALLPETEDFKVLSGHENKGLKKSVSWEDNVIYVEKKDKTFCRCKYKKPTNIYCKQCGSPINKCCGIKKIYMCISCHKENESEILYTHLNNRIEILITS